jgi:hypothetical protein
VSIKRNGDRDARNPPDREAASNEDNNLLISIGVIVNIRDVTLDRACDDERRRIHKDSHSTEISRLDRLTTAGWVTPAIDPSTIDIK